MVEIIFLINEGINATIHVGKPRWFYQPEYAIISHRTKVLWSIKLHTLTSILSLCKLDARGPFLFIICTYAEIHFLAQELHNCHFPWVTITGPLSATVIFHNCPKI